MTGAAIVGPVLPPLPAHPAAHPPMLRSSVCPPPHARFVHVCGAGCAPTPALVPALVPAAMPLPAVLPDRLTLHASPAMRYVELVCALTAAHARGVRRARVVLECPSQRRGAQ